MEPWHIVVTLICCLLAIVAGLNAWLLSLLKGTLAKVESRLELVRTAESCNRIRSDCVKFRDTQEQEFKKEADELWDAINHHSHTNIPEGSKVIR